MAKKSLQSSFAAASKLLGKMPDAQRQQFMQEAGGLFGGGDEFQGIGSVRNMYQAMQQMNPQQQAQMSQQLAGVFGQGPGINSPMGQPQQQWSNESAGTGAPNLNQAFAQGGGQQGQPPTLGQTAHQQQFAKQQQGSNAPTGTGGTPSVTTPAAPLNENPNLNASANKSPAISSPDYGTGAQFGAGPMTPGVTTDQLQGAVAGSSTLNTGPATGGQIFQAQYNPMINMPGQTDIMGQLSTPGRSNTMGQYGTGGIAGIAQQTAANQAAQQGIQGAQGLIAGNVQQQMGAQQLGSQFDLAQRQQQVQHLGAMLQPALSGASAGFGQALQGGNKMPQFLG